MKAYTKTKYGGPEVLQLEEVEKPSLEADHILVKVAANSANPADWHILRGKPFFARFSFGLFRPKYKIPGSDFSGIVEETGSDVSNFKPGDKVFGESLSGGAFAEYNSVPAKVCAIMPEGTGFTEMAGVPIAGITALQALTTRGQLKEGESVLIKNAFSKFPLAQFTAEINTKDLETLASLIQSKKIKVHIERTYPYNQIPEAIGYIEAMRTRGKVVMVWDYFDGP